MKRILRILLLCLLIILSPNNAVASDQNPGDVLITELQTGSASSASEEFVEIYNSTPEDIDISNWRLEYYSASTAIFTTPSRIITLHGILYSKGTYLIASTDYLTELADESYSAGFAKTGGHLRIVSSNLENQNEWIIHDLIGWGTAVQPETLSAPAPQEGTSLQRKIDAESNLIDTNNNNQDFDINAVPTPQSVNNPAPIPDPEPEPNPDPIPDPEPEPIPDPEPTPDPLPDPVPISTQLSPIINELFPNPAPPQTDDTDEFIELYNPNDTPFDLFEYKLQTGNSYSYSFTFDHTILLPKSYTSFNISDTNLILSNASGQARLIDPSGITISVTSMYEEADDGQSWSLDNDGMWKWSAQPTPFATNVITQPIIVTSVKKAATKKSTTAKTKKVSSPKVKAASSKAKKSSNTNNADQLADTQTIPALHSSVLAVVGAFALLYALYEYRYDIANKYHQFKRYRKARRDNR